MHICILTTGFPTPNDPGKYAFVDQLACTWADMGNEVTVIYPIPALVELHNKKRFYKPEWKRETSGGNTVTVRCPRFFSASDKVILGVDTRVIAYKSFQKAIRASIARMPESRMCFTGIFSRQGARPGMWATG